MQMKNRNIFIFLLLLSVSEGIMSQTAEKNYIQQRIFLNSDASKYVDMIEYHDKLGRKEQTVLVGASPAGGDIVTLNEYDEFGRSTKQWLPVSVTGNAGAFVEHATYKNEATSLYKDAAPFANTVYEASPLNKPIRQYGVGEDWQIAHDKYVKAETFLNKCTPDPKEVLNCYKYYAKVEDDIYHFRNDGLYCGGELVVVKTTDEQGNVQYVFSDHRGNPVLKRKVSGNTFLDTYFLYDKAGNLIAVFPPKLSDKMKNEDDCWDEPNDDIEDLAYLYYYDNKNRLVYKRLPGKGATRYVYDSSDALIMVNEDGRRIYSISDAMGRLCKTGLCSNSDYHAMGQCFNNTVYAERVSGGYDIKGLTLNNDQPQTVIFYDDYKFLTDGSLPSNVNGDLNYNDGFAVNGTPANAMGRKTGEIKYVINSDNTITDCIVTVIYYDAKGRPIQTRSTNHLDGMDIVNMQYDFVGKVLVKQHEHSTKYASLTETYSFTYDDYGRVLKETYRFNNNAEVTLHDYVYDAVGRMVRDNRNSTSIATDYKYNIRGQLTSISNKQFSQKIYYNEKRSGSTSPVRFDGKISSVEENDGAYDYTYDGVGRLKEAYYHNKYDLKDKWGNTDMYTTTYAYDRNGNVTSIGRKAWGNTDIDFMDDLMLHYDGNCLTGVLSYGNPDEYLIDNNPFDAENKVNIGYTYRNGNLVSDTRKGITNIEYNHLNLPENINFANGNRTSNKYLADGTKLRVYYSLRNTDVNGITTGMHETDIAAEQESYTIESTRDYCGNVQYQDGRLSRIMVDGGYCTAGGSFYAFVQDYRGSVRCVGYNNYTYYPDGKTKDYSTYQRNDPSQRYQFCGMERDEYNGLDLYDFHARWYDQELCQFTTMDPLCERYYDISPYAYCAGDPVNNIDPMGMDFYSTSDPQTILEFFNDLKYSATASTSNFELQIDDEYFLSHYYKNGNRYSVGYGWADSPNGVQFEGGYSVFSFEASTSFDFQSQMGDFFSISKQQSTLINAGNALVNGWLGGLVDIGISQGAYSNYGMSGMKFYTSGAKRQAAIVRMAAKDSFGAYKFVKGAGKLGCGISCLLAAHDAADALNSDRPDKYRRTAKALLDAGVAVGCMYLGPVGWAIGTTYFLVDVCGGWNYMFGIKDE